VNLSELLSNAISLLVYTCASHRRKLIVAAKCISCRGVEHSHLFRVSVRFSPCHWVTWAGANLSLLHLNTQMGVDYSSLQL
jgi:hypothetical protein